MMHSVVSDVRYAARELARRPGLTSTAVISLALGVGATSAVFSVIYAVLINPFPYPGSDRIMSIGLKDEGRQPPLHSVYRAADRPDPATPVA